MEGKLAVRQRQNDMVGGLVMKGRGDADLAVIGAREEARGGDGQYRSITRDDPDGIVDVSQHVVDGRRSARHERGSGATQHGAEQSPAIQEIGDLAPVVGRPQQDDTAERSRATVVDQCPCDQPAEGMRDDMQRVGRRGVQLRQSRCEAVPNLAKRLPPAIIAQFDCLIASPPQCARERAVEDRRTGKTMQEKDDLCVFPVIGHDV